MANSSGESVEDAEPEESLDLIQAIGAQYGPRSEWNPLRFHAYAQMALTFALLGIFVVILVGAGFALAYNWATIQEIKDLLVIFVPGLLTLLGAAVAFYFAATQ